MVSDAMFYPKTPLFFSNFGRFESGNTFEQKKHETNTSHVSLVEYQPKNSALWQTSTNTPSFTALFVRKALAL